MSRHKRSRRTARLTAPPPVVETRRFEIANGSCDEAHDRSGVAMTCIGVSHWRHGAGERVRGGKEARLKGAARARDGRGDRGQKALPGHRSNACFHSNPFV